MMFNFLQSSCLLLLMAAVHAAPAYSYAVTITAGPRTIYLQVGNGTFTGTFNGGGSPGTNTTVNLVTVTVPAAQVGNGTAQTMTTNSTQTASFLDNFTFCTVPAQVYIGGYFRLPGTTGTATLTVNTPATLTTTGSTIPFTKISWISSGIGDTGVQAIPSGTFTGGTQTLTTYPVNTWRESCHAFSYLNDQVVGSGTYTGRATYTLSAP